jgi:hypothetical protein
MINCLTLPAIDGLPNSQRVGGEFARLCRKEEFFVLEAWTPSASEGWSPFSPLTLCPGCLNGEFQFLHHLLDAGPLLEQYLF